MSVSERERVEDVLEHLEILRRHLSHEGVPGETVFDAVNRRLSAAIEALQAGGTALPERLFGDEWPLMWATRNRIAHGYRHIDRATIELTVERDLPVLEAALRDEHARLVEGVSDDS